MDVTLDGRTKVVMADALKIDPRRLAEPIDFARDVVLIVDPRPDGHPRPGDPSPAEIEEAKAEIRRARKSGRAIMPRRSGPRPRPYGPDNDCLGCGKPSWALYCDACAPPARRRKDGLSSDRRRNGLDMEQPGLPCLNRHAP